MLSHQAEVSPALSTSAIAASIPSFSASPTASLLMPSPHLREACQRFTEVGKIAFKLGLREVTLFNDDWPTVLSASRADWPENHHTDRDDARD
jgi:hypothetical protein